MLSTLDVAEYAKSQASENMAAATSFVNSTLKLTLKQENLMQELKDGIILSRLLQRLTGDADDEAESCPSSKPENVETPAQSSPFTAMDRISKFLEACKSRLRLDLNDICDVADLYQEKSSKAVISTILALSRTPQAIRLASSESKNSHDTESEEKVSEKVYTDEIVESGDKGRFQGPLTNNVNVDFRSEESLGDKGYAEEAVKVEGIQRTSSILSEIMKQHSPSKEKVHIRGDHADSEVIADYQLGKCIGKGQFGAVYTALNLSTGIVPSLIGIGKIVAIKRIRIGKYANKDLVHETFSREINFLKQLNHENIVTYHGFNLEGNFINIVLEYVENGSLYTVLKNFTSQLPEGLVSKYTKQVLHGLAYLHSKGVAHCDLKAANILVLKNGLVKISDFGVSKQLGSTARDSTFTSESSRVDPKASSLSGSAHYLAPEVIMLEESTTKSDLWSLGCTIHELLTGAPPVFFAF
ncbi:MAG: hypothetical protein SGCHY_000012 [Lobulomycetales sp.]